MNVLFHTTAAIGIVALLTDTKRIEQCSSRKIVLPTGIFAFIAGLIVHGALDFMPHGYPVNARIDTLGGLAMIITVTWLANKKYRLVMLLSFLGSIFPDLIDLSPAILNKQLGLSLPVPPHIFPWHWPEYSGSLYSGACTVSALNHLLLILGVTGACWLRRSDLKAIFHKSGAKQSLT